MKGYLILFMLFFLTIGHLYGAPQGRKVIKFEAIKIKGEIQKPEAIFFLSRARFTYQTLKLDISFLKKIKEGVYKKGVF